MYMLKCFCVWLLWCLITIDGGDGGYCPSAAEVTTLSNLSILGAACAHAIVVHSANGLWNVFRL